MPITSQNGTSTPVSPTTITFNQGKAIAGQEGILTVEQLHNTFDPEKLITPIEKAPLLKLIQDEANLIDQIAPMMAHLKKLQKEIKRRRSFDGALVLA